MNEDTMEQSAVLPSGRRVRIERKLIESARGHLGDEEVLKIFRGQTFVSPVMLPALGSLLFIAKARTVIVTERSVVTVAQSMWSQSTVVALISRHDCGSVPVHVSRWGLQIADDDKIFALLSTLADMREVARLARARS